MFLLLETSWDKWIFYEKLQKICKGVTTSSIIANETEENRVRRKDTETNAIREETYNIQQFIRMSLFTTTEKIPSDI